jgi:TPP-dependent pyruvate/acetoin dehydrogenase alpha subunit
MDKLRLYEKMFIIRTFELLVEEYFARGLLRGTTHGSIGQEAVAVGVLNNVDIKLDYVTSSHRGHGHFLVVTDDSFGLISEMMGKSYGVVKGKGGSQHLKKDNFITNGITGGMIPIAVGLGFTQKLKRNKKKVISFLGDGAMNEGYVLEALNLAAIYCTNNIFVLENNNYAMSSFTADLTGGSFKDRIESFGIEYHFVSSSDVLEITEKMNKIYQNFNNRPRPIFIEFDTFRFCGHSKSDKKEYMDQFELKQRMQLDPLIVIKKQLDLSSVNQIEKRVKIRLTDDFAEAANLRR